MAAISLHELYARYIKGRPESEKRRLVDLILDDVGREPRPRRRWLDLLGIAGQPLVGEDAQQYVSRGRREDDARNSGQR